MKYLGMLVLFFTQCVWAYCPEPGLQVSLQGRIELRTYPGPPNWEDIKNGDEPLDRDVLVLDSAMMCDLGEIQNEVPEIELIYRQGLKGCTADTRWCGKAVLVSGLTREWQSARDHTLVQLVVSDINEVSEALTAEQQKSMLRQFQQFQQALREKNVARLKTFFVFPLEGQFFDFTLEPGDLTNDERFSSDDFDRNALKIIAGLQPLTQLTVVPETLTISEYRVNALSAEEQQRQYAPADEEGMFYYVENGQRHEIFGACDNVIHGDIDAKTLNIYQGTSANKQLPGISEACDGGTSYLFKLIDGKLRLVRSFSAG
ncbi:hypothetical protein HCH17_22635 [Klebsiella aerogenes]|uniref:hypothetical protein n=1 Tax=Klebsiella TaxID=570 RepID=UPI001C8BCA4D|nr:hypothetical protein [Klebsiella aerogenes]EIV3803941.1 hypothetical protein [Klebsiella aerogenes]EIV7215422.1 hypothetical protein [Klebsiella aerogenes]EMB4081270.1 hypothetical protein [Klebsiella aerogenes]MBX9001484.1 hypothetical protein [Klebsiella aerogenes]MDK6932047.1 hypothetical protein [Klebsiella aerogenes]